MWRRPELLLFVLIACKRDQPSPSVVDASAAIPTPVASSAPVVVVDATPPSPPPSVPPVVERHAKKAKSIGHTSVVFKIEQTDGKKIVWKPDSRIGKGRYRGEIAAYRLATLLGIDNVPPALPLDIARDELSRAVAGDEKGKQLFEEQVVFDGNVAHGMFTEWIDDYAVLPLENDKAWKDWLKKGGTIPDDKKDWARAISTLVLFDYVTGNWDRWSGGNVATSKGKILFVDNDGAFFETPPKDGLERNKRSLESVDRFSKSFVEKVRALTEQNLRESMRGLLSDKALAGVLARRDEALAIVEKKELFFP